MPAEGREGKTLPPRPEDRETFAYNLDDVIGNGLVSAIDQVALRNRIDECALLERDQGAEIDPSDELCWLSLAVGWFLAKGYPPDVAKAAALFVRYHTDHCGGGRPFDEHHHQDGE